MNRPKGHMRTGFKDNTATRDLPESKYKCGTCKDYRDCLTVYTTSAKMPACGAYIKKYKKRTK